MRLGALFFFVGLATVAACTPFQNAASDGDGGFTAPDAEREAEAIILPDAAGAADAGHAKDATITKDAGSPVDATTSSVDTGTAKDTGGGTTNNGISSLLALPAADAATCMPVGNIVVCPIGNCLIADPTGVGRCQNCQGEGSCGGHKNAPCATAEDCDIDWACYNGKCTLMCNLDAGMVFCAYPQVCTNVGNQYEGVCQP